MKFFHYRAVLLAISLSGIAWLAYTGFDYFFLHHGQFPYRSLLTGNLPGHEHGLDPIHQLAIRVIAVLLLACFAVLISYYLNQLEESKTLLNHILDSLLPVCVTDNAHRIVRANASYREIFGPVSTAAGPLKCHESRPGPKCGTEECPLIQISQRGKKSYTCESSKRVHDTLHHYIVTATPLLNHKARQTGIIESFQDITPLKELEGEKEKLIGELEEALGKVKLLSGFIPICAACKKIRDDKGYWTQIETYIRNHSEAEFSHGICPECFERLYGEEMRNA